MLVVAVPIALVVVARKSTPQHHESNKDKEQQSKVDMCDAIACDPCSVICLQSYDFNSDNIWVDDASIIKFSIALSVIFAQNDISNAYVLYFIQCDIAFIDLSVARRK